jgi:4-amino-4-deoxy-L-arabinose transferase-like glycosyltransferase
MLRKKKILLILIFILAFVLRTFNLTKSPPSLYWEEVALGYDAYSLLKTGKDHRGNSWPIVYIESYKDYKPPLYVYLTIPSVALFGLNDFAVRFPSALLGSLMVLLTFFIAKEIFFKKYLKDGKKIWDYIPLVSALLLAISPWHLQFSRAAFEVNTALFLISLGLYLFLKGLRKKSSFVLLPLSAFFFSLSFYTYHGVRVFLPLFLLVLFILFFKNLVFKKFSFLTALVLGFLLLLPLGLSLKQKQIQQRFQETSAFTTLEPILISNQKIKLAGEGRLAKLVHHRYWEYGSIFIQKYFSHFNGNFLFLYGDENLRHNTKEFALLYHWEIVTLLLGMYLLFKKIDRKKAVLLVWLFLSPVPAALTKATPHSLRTLLGLPAFIFISSYGLVYLFTLINKSDLTVGVKKLFLTIKLRNLFLTGLVFIIIVEFGIYLHFYHHHYPKLYSQVWQYGYKKTVNYLGANHSNYDYVYLADAYGRAYMYLLFYLKMDPVKVQNYFTANKESISLEKIDKFYINKKPPEKGSKLWATVSIPNGEKVLQRIDFLDSSPAFYIWEEK